MMNQKEWCAKYGKHPKVIKWLEANPAPEDWKGTPEEWAYLEMPQPAAWTVEDVAEAMDETEGRLRQDVARAAKRLNSAIKRGKAAPAPAPPDDPIPLDPPVPSPEPAPAPARRGFLDDLSEVLRRKQ